MQERLYSQGGLQVKIYYISPWLQQTGMCQANLRLTFVLFWFWQAEGIFRINPENSEEEKVRGYLNRGIVPEEMDVHCLAGLIKAWFRELPSGVLDGLCPQQVLECKADEEYIDLVNQLNPTESALLNWAVDLMADVVEHENLNKMNSRNIAMVFAPNMTQVLIYIYIYNLSLALF